MTSVFVARQHGAKGDTMSMLPRAAVVREWRGTVENLPVDRGLRDLARYGHTNSYNRSVSCSTKATLGNLHCMIRRDQPQVSRR